jgi:regulator of RNase E activity RraA
MERLSGLVARELPVEGEDFAAAVDFRAGLAGARLDHRAEEAAGQKGVAGPGIRPAWREPRVCGPALTAKCPARDNPMLH